MKIYENRMYEMWNKDLLSYYYNYYFFNKSLFRSFNI